VYVPRLNSTGCTNDLEDRNNPLTPMIIPKDPPATKEITEPFCHPHTANQSRKAANTNVGLLSKHTRATLTLMYAVTPPTSRRVAKASVEYTTACRDIACTQQIHFRGKQLSHNSVLNRLHRKHPTQGKQHPNSLKQPGIANNTGFKTGTSQCCTRRMGEGRSIGVSAAHYLLCGGSNVGPFQTPPVTCP
jgi:hypothetical protein